MELRHWGDLAKGEKGPESVPDVSADIELSMNKLFLSHFEEPEDPSLRTQQIIVPPLNPHVSHAITLHKHASAISEMIKSIRGGNKTTERVEFQMPEFIKTTRTMTGLNLSATDFQNFANGDDVTVAALSESVVRAILTKSVATLFAQIGFENSQESALDVLTDVIQEFYRKICHHVKVATQDDEIHQFLGFPNVIERVLTEMGIGGIQALEDYYQSRVIKYVNVLENRCKDLTDDYQNLLIPRAPSPVDKFNKVVRVKVEEEDVIEVENPEVHFSTIDGDVSFSILETGYQLLNSLEAETNLHSMADSVEDIAVTQSPGIVSLSSDDASHLSPYSKKKRFK